MTGDLLRILSLGPSVCGIQGLQNLALEFSPSRLFLHSYKISVHRYLIHLTLCKFYLRKLYIFHLVYLYKLIEVHIYEFNILSV